MAEQGAGIRQQELEARLAEDARLADRLGAMSHRHLFRRIEAPELTAQLQAHTEYPGEALDRVGSGYLCEGCGTLGSLVYSGAQHPVHYLSNAGAL
jgi:hypothetical protein